MAVQQRSEPTPLSMVIAVTLAGLVAALLEIIVTISFAAMVFSAELSVFRPQGIGIALVSSLLVCAVLAVLSGFRGVVSGVQDAGIVVLAIVAQHLIADFDDPTANRAFVTLIVFIALSTLVTGVFFLVLGRFRLGNLIRFIPYPVIGGFLAAVGWILLQGAFSIIGDYSLSVDGLGTLLEADHLARWLPAAIFGAVLFVATRVNSHFLLLPALLVGGIIVFYGIVLAAGETVVSVLDDGWLLGPFPAASAWQPIFLEDLGAVDWDFVRREIWHIPTIALVSAIGLLLNISGMEVQSDDEVEVNRELTYNGLANVGVGLSGGFVGFPTISLTMLAWRMKGHSRLTGLIQAAVFVVVLILGFDLIAYFPRFVLGGLLIYLGISILVEWLYDGWWKMPLQDYVILVLIVVLIATVGYLEGVAFGLAAAAALFTYNYSRIDNVKQRLSGQTYQSRIERPHTLDRALHARGERVIIYRLNGYIFFGSAHSLLARIMARVEGATPADGQQFLVLDFRQVQAVDSSAILTFIRLQQLLERREIVLIFCEMDRHVAATFQRSDFDLTERAHFRRFAALDEAVEWCEERLLREITLTGLVIPRQFAAQLAALFPDLDNPERLLAVMERVEVPAGARIAQEGDTAQALYWVESGRLRAEVQLGETAHRVRVAQAGAVLGEMGLYADRTRSASIVADEPTVFYTLSKAALDQLERDNPAVAITFHRMIACILSDRLADSTARLQHYL